MSVECAPEVVFFYSPPEHETTMYVNELSPSVQEGDLQAALGNQTGTLLYRVFRSRRCASAVLRYYSRREAIHALYLMQGAYLHSLPMRLSLASPWHGTPCPHTEQTPDHSDATMSDSLDATDSSSLPALGSIHSSPPTPSPPPSPSQTLSPPRGPYPGSASSDAAGASQTDESDPTPTTTTTTICFSEADAPHSVAPRHFQRHRLTLQQCHLLLRHFLGFDQLSSRVLAVLRLGDIQRLEDGTFRLSYEAFVELHSPFDASLAVVGKGIATGTGKDLVRLIGRAQKTATTNAQRHAFSQLAIFLSDERLPTLFQLPGADLRSAHYRQCAQDAMATARPAFFPDPVPPLKPPLPPLSLPSQEKKPQRTPQQRKQQQQQQRPTRGRGKPSPSQYHYHRREEGPLRPSPIGVVPPHQARADLLYITEQQHGEDILDLQAATEFHTEFVETEYSTFEKKKKKEEEEEEEALVVN